MCDELPTLVPLNQSSLMMNVFCTHVAGGGVSFYEGVAKQLAHHARFYGLEDPLIYDDFEYDSIPELAEYHIDTIKSVQPEGPYTLFGYCSGGPIAYEIARQLTLAGDEVNRLVVIGSRLNAVVMGLDTQASERFLFLKEYLSDKYQLDLTKLNWSAFEKQEHDQVISAIIDELITQGVNGVTKQEKWIPLAIKSLYFMRKATQIHKARGCRFDIDLYERYTANAMRDKVMPWVDWNNITTGKLNVIPAPEVQGGHNDVLAEPYLNQTVSKIKSNLFNCL